MKNQKQKGFLGAVIAVVAVIAVLTVGGYVAYKSYSEKENQDESVVCTMDAKQCPDGSFVSRVAPNCDFEPCPEINNNPTAGWQTYANTEYGFEVKYPQTSVLFENNEDTVWFGGTNQINLKTIATISTPTASSREFFVVFFVASGNNAINNCNKINLNSQASNITETKNINGTIFYVTEYSDAAMGGKRDNVTQYTVLKNNLCYLIQGNATWTDVSFVHGATDGKQPTQQELDEQNQKIKDGQNFVDGVISTFKFIP